MDKRKRIFVAGHRGLVGSALVRRLEGAGCSNLLLRSRSELDLLDQQVVRRFFADERPELVFVAAAKVGGIEANRQFPAEFLYENLTIAGNVIHAAFEHNAEKLLFLGSSCIYPRLAKQPITEDALLTGPLEPTNEAYAIAKIAGLKLCEAYHRQHGARFISAMPTNLYGPGDNFHPEGSHVVPGMMRKFHEAKKRGDAKTVIWGTGTPRREFLHVDDLASALVTLMERYEEPTTINVGTGEDCTILELAEMVKEVVGFEGEIGLDTERPDGTPRKCLDVSRIHALGWKHQIGLKEGLIGTYQWAQESGILG